MVSAQQMKIEGIMSRSIEIVIEEDTEGTSLNKFDIGMFIGYYSTN